MPFSLPSLTLSLRGCTTFSTKMRIRMQYSASVSSSSYML
jgi:hypothetical protein